MVTTTIRPGTDINMGQTIPEVSFPTDTGTTFVLGTASQGPTAKAGLCLNIDEFTQQYGPRIPAGQTVPTSGAWDAVDVMFKSGVSRLYFGRVAGPAASPATHTFSDSVAGASTTIQSNGPGPSTLKIAILVGSVGGTIQVQVQDAAGNILDQSPNCFTVADIVAWARFDSLGYIVAVSAGANLPAVIGATALTGGTNDNSNVTDTIRIAALPVLFPINLGPGQVCCPGSTTAAMQAGLSDFCATVPNRTCLLDGPDTAVKATAQAALASWRSACVQPLSETFGLMSSPWRVVPGAGGSFSRTVPPSAVIAGLIARSDGQFGNPNLAAAGGNGIDRYSFGSSQPEWSDQDRTDLNTSGIACFANIYGQQQLYGFRSGAYAADINAASNQWQSFAASRLRMALWNEFNIIGQDYLFDQLDGQGLTIASFVGAITGVLLRYWGLGALYGASAADAFAVDGGPSVNTPTTIQNQELHAKVGIKESPFNELSVFDFTKIPLTEVLAA